MSGEHVAEHHAIGSRGNRLGNISRVLDAAIRKAAIAGGMITLRRAGLLKAMREVRPDFFIHSGDNIYADGPIVAEQKMPNGQIWKNVVTEDKAKPAETLAEFRGNYKYNLTDANLRAFNAEVPIFAQWDDHEVTDDWIPGGNIRHVARRVCRTPDNC